MVLGIGEMKTPKPFIKACDKFIYVDVLVPSVPVQEQANAAGRAVATSAQPQKKPISTKTVNFIAQCIQESANESGQALLAPLGSILIKKKPEFDSRNYGYQKLSKLLRAINRFEVGGAGTHVWVKDKKEES